MDHETVYIDRVFDQMSGIGCVRWECQGVAMRRTHMPVQGSGGLGRKKYAVISVFLVANTDGSPGKGSSCIASSGIVLTSRCTRLGNGVYTLVFTGSSEGRRYRPVASAVQNKKLLNSAHGTLTARDPTGYLLEPLHI